ncbi:TonB-dependent receptor [Bacteroides sp.]|uniref:TonB-dependent receptor n=1 Tax=Bacteroides sp. TaxID=29523 RepID=UPI002584B024|nr:TonB-dependent receptor [Bacteroides sp.]
MENSMKSKSFYLLLLLLFVSMPIKAFAQEQRVSLNYSNAPLGEVLDNIGRITSLSVVYNVKDIDANEAISINVQDETVTNVLSKLFNGTSVSYSFLNNHIVLSKETKTTSKNQQKDSRFFVKGNVTDASGEPLIGVSIQIKGSATGTITDLDGNFSLQVEKGSVIELSYIGYEKQSVKIIGDKPLNIVLKEDNKVLDEVVVTALGIKRAEKALSYNVQQVKQDDLTKVKDANFVNSLSGKVAGVTINKSASGVGGATKVVMRGAKSIEGDNNVLYVIDGIPIFNYSAGADSGIMGEGKVGSEGIADFNPEDVESISVLSGPSAAALYGSNAANGAILITTKKGEEGKAQVTYSSTADFSRPLMMPKFQNRYGNKAHTYESWGDRLTTPSDFDPRRDFFNTGTNFINSVTLTTGNKHNQTFASIASTNSKGIVPNNTYDRYNFTVRNTSKMLDDKLQLDLGASYVKQKDKNMVSQGQYWNPIVAAYLYPRGESFEKIKTFERFNADRNLPAQYWPIADGVFANQNPYWTAFRNVAPNNKDRFMFNGGLTYHILDWLNVSGRIRMDKSFVKSERKIYATSHDVFAKSKGHYEYGNYEDNQLYSDFMVNINKHLKDFSIAANIGLSYSDYSSLTRGYKGNLILVPNLFSAHNIDPAEGSIKEEGGDTNVRNFAMFASAELGWRSMIYLTLTGRNDWNSRLVNSKEESFFYPSVGLSAIVSEMVNLPKAISYLKVRGSYTEVGAPISKSGMTPGTITIPIKGGVIKPTGIYPYGDFKAERTKSYEVGVTARFFNKIHLDATWYKSNTYNQTFIGDLPESSGYKAVYLQAGDIENKGWEVSLGYNDQFGDFGVSSTLSYTKNKNKIKEMVENYQHPLSPEPINIPEVSKDKGRVILKAGGSINDIYASKFFKKDNQGHINISETGELVLENTDPVYLGKTTPDYTLGWNNSFSYKGFGLSFLVNARVGGVVTSSTEAVLDRFGVSKASADARDNGGVLIPNQGYNARIDAKKYYQMIGTGESELAGFYTYSATNVRLQELTLSYSFPASWFNNVIQNLTLSFIASNPWMIYCKAPYDPELTPSTGTYGQGNDYFMQPSLRSLGFGVKVKF